MTLLCQHYLLSMSASTTIAKLTAAECERGQIAQRPPISYAVSKSGLLLSTTRDTIKLKSLEGEFKQSPLGDNPNPEELSKHINFFMRHKEKIGVEEKLEKAAQLAASTAATLKKKEEANIKRLKRVQVTKEELVKAKV